MNSLALLSAEGFIIEFNLSFLIEILPHILSVLLLFYILYRLLFKPVREVLEKRKQGIENDLNEAATAKKNAEALKSEYENKISNIQEEADQILKDAHQRALDKEKAMIHEAQAEAERIINRAKVEIEREKQKARDELKQDVVSIASSMAGKFVAISLDEKLQEKLIDETIAEMGDNTWQA